MPPNLGERGGIVLSPNKGLVQGDLKAHRADCSSAFHNVSRSVLKSNQRGIFFRRKVGATWCMWSYVL